MFSDLHSIYDWAENVNMTFNSKKFEWMRYVASPEGAPAYQYKSPENTHIVESVRLQTPA